MIKMTISKIRKICSVALMPRILRDEFSLTRRKLGKRPLDGYWRMNKSTDSKDKDSECEKCKKLIELVFGPGKPDPVLKQVEANLDDIHMDKLQKTIAPSLIMEGKSKESSQQGPSDTRKELESISSNLQSAGNESQQKPITNILQSTTAKEEKEELTQKLETIKEPELVEAGVPKIEDFNTPKVLGGRETIFDNKNICTKIGPEEDPLDTIAKKCLGTPPDKIDERIMEELKSCGMLGRGRRRPGLRRNGSHRSGKKEPLMETKPEECMLYFEKTQTPMNPIHTYPLTRYQNTQNDLRKVHSAYFKNPTNSSAESEPKGKEHKNVYANQEQEKTKNLFIDNRVTEETNLETPTVIINKPQDTNDIVLEEPSKRKEILKSITNQEQNPKTAVENIEVETEEIRVSAAETSRLGISNFTESEKKEFKLIEHEREKTDLPELNKSSAINKNHSIVAFSDVKNPINWEFGPEIGNKPFNLPNTAISGTLPYPDKEPDPESQDTAISAWQDPAEFYDLAHCDTEKVDANAIKPSTIRPLEAYDPYTIISKAEKLQMQKNILLSSKEPLNEATSETAQDEKEVVINKDISATIGPLPQIKDMEEELSLTEMLKRVRERNRLQYCRECEYKSMEAEPVEANKCPPPLDKGPAKTLGPGPCRPKAKPAAPPPPKCPPPCPQPCPPPCKPKDPCAKFVKTTLIGNKIKEAFTLVLQVGFKPACAFSTLCYENLNAAESLKQLSPDDVYRTEKLASFLLSNSAENTKVSNKEDVILARDFEPWSPIPSWPIPKKEKKDTFVCPKEGCKIIPPPRLNPPCKENPCINLPKRSFSAMDVDYEPLYLYQDEY